MGGGASVFHGPRLRELSRGGGAGPSTGGLRRSQIRAAPGAQAHVRPDEFFQAEPEHPTVDRARLVYQLAMVTRAGRSLMTTEAQWVARTARVRDASTLIHPRSAFALTITAHIPPSRADFSRCSTKSDTRCMTRGWTRRTTERPWARPRPSGFTNRSHGCGRTTSGEATGSGSSSFRRFGA